MGMEAGKYKTGSEKYSIGFIGGIIHMLDFRKNAPKLPLDRRHGIIKHASGNPHSSKKHHKLDKSEEKKESLNLSFQNEAENGDLSLTSIRKLMHEEMPSLYLSRHNVLTKLKNPKPELETSHEDTKLLGIHKMHSGNLEVSKNLLSGQSPLRDPLEVFSSDLNFGALVQEFYNNKYKVLVCKTENKETDLFRNHSELQKALHEILDPFYKHFVANYNGKLPKSDEFLKASEVMGLNKDTFLKFLQDPDCPVLKQMREDPNFSETKTREIGTVKQRRDALIHNLSQKKSIRNILRKRNKFNGESKSHSNKKYQQLKKIVLVKPVTAIQRNNMHQSRSNSSAGSLRFLKPNNKNEKAISGFSFREIARRLRHSIGERKREEFLISTDCNVFDIPTVHSALTDQGSNYIERLSQPITNNNKKENARKHLDVYPLACDDSTRQGTRETCQPDLETKFQTEAKNDLLEIHCTDDGQNFSASQAHTSLEMLLRMPNHIRSSLNSSSGRRAEPELSPKAIMLSPTWNPNCHHDNNQESMITHIIESSYSTTISSNVEAHLIEPEGITKEEMKQDCSLREISSLGLITEEQREPELSQKLITLSPPRSPGIKMDTIQQTTLPIHDSENFPSTANKPNAEVDSLEWNLNPVTRSSQVEEFSCSKEASNAEGTIDVIDIGGDKLLEEQNSVESGTNTSVNATDDCEDYKSPKPRLDILEFGKRESTKIITANPDRPSPTSILEQPFSDDITSPGTTDVDSVFRLQVAPREIHFDNDLKIFLTTPNKEFKRRTCMEEEEFKHNYIHTLLKSSGLSKHETWERLQFSEQLLDTSIYYELETPNGETPDDLNLLFDCICEVLQGIRRRYFNSRPWISSIGQYQHSFPSIEKLVQEILKGTTCNPDLRIQSTLTQIIKRDIDAGTWMDIGSGTEEIEVDIGDEFFEEILEDVVLELWQLNYSATPRP